jgi:hypothetical protein
MTTEEFRSLVLRAAECKDFELVDMTPPKPVVTQPARPIPLTINQAKKEVKR